MTHLIDTDVAIHLRDLTDGVLDRLSNLARPPSISIISLVELEAGVYVKPPLTAWRRDRLDALLEDIAIVPFDHDCVAAYGRIVAAAGFSRRKVADRMIAATALVYGLTLVTMNAADFRDVPGLVIDDWAVA